MYPTTGWAVSEENKPDDKDKKLFEKLSRKRKSVWDSLKPEEVSEVFAFADGYKVFLDNAKTEREAVNSIRKFSESIVPKFVSEKDCLDLGFYGRQKFYQINRGKNIALVVLGKAGVFNGVKMIVSHLDSPRLDLKPNPVCESSGMAFLRTHYYGGIKKYQWVCRPLAMHGKVIKADGAEVDIVIGEDAQDLVFSIGDLLPHLSKERTAEVAGEKLKVIAGSMPFGDAEMGSRLKFRVLKYLHDTYGLCEEDFTSAELEIVPAGLARDVGFDRSMVGGYGQDDRVCAYASLQAIFEVEPLKNERTAIAFFLDKEEIGSEGNTGAQSTFIENVLSDVIAVIGYGYNESYLRQALSLSSAISADVTAAVDPDWEEVHEMQNASLLGYGVSIEKYTGSGGKYDANDAGAEYTGKIRKMLNDAGVVWQADELGKIDTGGGGTVAKFLAKRGMDVIDMGVPVVAMHSPFEIVSKADIYMAYKAYKAFFRS